MTLPVSSFINPAQDSYEYHAVQKALREQPRVVLIGQVDVVRYFEVTSTGTLGMRYPVRMWEDNDRAIEERDGELFISEHGRFWIECYCAAGYPPVHPFTDIIAWLPRACYHCAAVIILEAKP